MILKVIAGLAGLLIAFILWNGPFGGMRGDPSELEELESTLVSAQDLDPHPWNEEDRDAFASEVDSIGHTITIPVRPAFFSLVWKSESATANFIAGLNPDECGDMSDDMGGLTLGEWIAGWNAPTSTQVDTWTIGEFDASTTPGTESQLVGVLECLEAVPGIRIDTFSFNYDGDDLFLPTGPYPASGEAGGNGTLSISGGFLYRFQTETPETPDSEGEAIEGEPEESATQ